MTMLMVLSGCRREIHGQIHQVDRLGLEERSRFCGAHRLNIPKFNLYTISVRVLLIPAEFTLIA